MPSKDRFLNHDATIIIRRDEVGFLHLRLHSPPKALLIDDKCGGRLSTLHSYPQIPKPRPAYGFEFAVVFQL